MIPWRGGATVVAAALLAFPAQALAAAAPAALQQQMGQAGARIQQLQAQIATEQGALAAAQGTAAAWERRRGVAEAQMRQEAQAVAQLDAGVSGAELALHQAQAADAAATLHLQQLQQDAAQDLRGLYEGGRVGLLDTLLGSVSFSQFLDRFRLMEAIFAADTRLLTSIRAQQEAVAQQQSEVLGRLQTLQTLARQTQVDVQRYQQEAADYRRSASAAEGQAYALQREIQAEQAASDAVAAQLDSLRLQYDRSTGRLAFAWPLPAPHLITSPFGHRCIQVWHICDFHTGIDVAEPTGTPIRAAAGGVVASAGWQGGYGNAVVLYHGKVAGKTYYTLYAHQSRIAVRRGQTVRQGQVIGYVGATGFATGPHLHFEVRIDGQPVNPLPLLPPAGVVKDY